jgi:hypothetical protein
MFTRRPSRASWMLAVCLLGVGTVIVLWPPVLGVLVWAVALLVLLD